MRPSPERPPTTLPTRPVPQLLSTWTRPIPRSRPRPTYGFGSCNDTYVNPNDQSSKIQKKFKNLKIGDIGISAITYAELQFGVSNSSKPEQNQEALTEFLGPLEILDFPADACPLYGELKKQLKASGNIIGPMDLLIGAHALFLKFILITNNVNEFSRIKGLKIENWT
jgi:tRNA(fMet)-specific endonuclease VapC